VAPSLPPRPRNPEWTGFITGLLLIAAGAAGMLLPPRLGIAGMSGGFALAFIGFFVILVGLIVSLFWWQRVRLFQRIFSGDQVLAAWQLNPEQVRQQALAARQERLAHHRAIYLVMLFFAVVFGVIFFVIPVANEEMHPAVLLAWFGFFAFLGLVAWGTPRLEYLRSLRSHGEVYIHPRGVFQLGALTTWAQPFTRLVGVQLRPSALGPSLEFRIRYLSRASLSGTQEELLRVPVPPGQEEQVERVLRHFSSRPQAGKPADGR
jgi:hypothetical protein